MLKSLKIRHVGPAKEFDLEFGERLNVLTGDNGLGKSLLLDIAWWACARDWPSGPVVPARNVIPARFNLEELKKFGEVPDGLLQSEILGKTGKTTTSSFKFLPENAEWKRKGPGRPSIAGLIIYARIDGGFSIWDPSRHYYLTIPPVSVDDPERSPAFHFSRNEMWNGKRIDDPAQGEITLCEGLLHDWLEWEKREADLFDVFKKILLDFSPPDEKLAPSDKPVRVPGRGVTSMPALSANHGVIPLQHTSAGVRRVLGLAYSLVWTWHEHKIQCATTGQTPETRIILIVDEIESHLHPKWQRSILPALLSVGKTLGDNIDIQFIVSTHSPLVLASLETEFDAGRDRLFHLELEQGEVTLQQEDWERYGDVSNWLMSDIFDLKEAHSLPAEATISKAEEMMRAGTDPLPSREKVKEIDAALRAVLPDHDPVLARWSLFKRLLSDKGLSI